MFQPGGEPYKFAHDPATPDKFNDWQHGYLLLDVNLEKGKIFRSYVAVDDPTSAQPPTASVKPFDTFSVPV
jgi:hypothetical protein